MKKLFLATLVGFACVGLPIALADTAASVPAAAPVLTVKGDVLHPTKWTLAQLQGQTDVQEVSTTLKDAPYNFKGIPVATLIEAAGPRLDLKMKHSEARFMVIVRAADGYSAAFSWPELMPGLGSANAYLAWEANGKPLEGKEGPLRLVVVGDKKPMRWVYNITSIKVVDSKHFGK